ncbi:MAG: nicotinate-nucleotide adenylyltransferase [Deltaproteobacteria bacterium]|nr:nicotinate-nucleotide adenylyltransferase [Deltaproteobacteria bacterium]
MRLGLLGGTFSPIHQGHLRSAEEIWEDFSLDRVVFIPAFLPPHKNDKPVLDFNDRMAMCQLAVEENPHFTVSDLEQHRQGKSFSIDTIKDFREDSSEDELHFILGMDAFLSIPTWEGFQELFALTHFIVMTRPGYPRGDVEEILEAVSPDFRHDPRQARYLHPAGCFVHFWETTLLDISSTRIRQYIRESKSISYLVPLQVEKYIYRHGLYR